MAVDGTRPEAIARAEAEGRVTDLDVRPDLLAGREPFSRIMAAVAGLPAGHVLRLRAIFEPVPLYRVLGRQGFDHWTERRAEDDWVVWFVRGTETVAAPQPARAAEPAVEGDPAVVVLDVRGLEPPEPMTRTLEALERLPEHASLLQINERVPRFLLPRLAERGFAWEILHESADEVRVMIRRASG
ncbi:MAG TPA: DUF2249 domain-containing protein [Thermodesulfobacteriota bacterium]